MRERATPDKPKPDDRDQYEMDHGSDPIDWLRARYRAVRSWSQQHPIRTRLVLVSPFFFTGAAIMVQQLDWRMSVWLGLAIVIGCMLFVVSPTLGTTSKRIAVSVSILAILAIGWAVKPESTIIVPERAMNAERQLSGERSSEPVGIASFRAESEYVGTFTAEPSIRNTQALGDCNTRCYTVSVNPESWKMEDGKLETAIRIGIFETAIGIGPYCWAEMRTDDVSLRFIVDDWEAPEFGIWFGVVEDLPFLDIHDVRNGCPDKSLPQDPGLLEWLLGEIQRHARP